jgi:hypothetical protein
MLYPADYNTSLVVVNSKVLGLDSEANPTIAGGGKKYKTIVEVHF